AEEADHDRASHPTAPADGGDGPRVLRAEGRPLEGRRHLRPPALTPPRYTKRRAAMLTIRVMAKRIRPEAIRASWPAGPASPNLVAMLAAMVLPPGSRMFQVMLNVADRTRATAIVSPRARPRPSMTAPVSPPRAGGSTAILMTSQRVAPRAMAA